MHLQPLLRALRGLLGGRQLAQRRAVLHLQLAQLLPGLPLGALSCILQARAGRVLPGTAGSASDYALASLGQPFTAYMLGSLVRGVLHAARAAAACIPACVHCGAQARHACTA